MIVHFPSVQHSWHHRHPQTAALHATAGVRRGGLVVCSATKSGSQENVLASLSVTLLTEGLRAAGVGAKECEGRASQASTAVKPLRPGDVRGLERLLRQDFERNQYFVTGVVTDAIYDEQCEFVDPTVWFKGRDLWKRNLSLLTPFLIEPQIQLKSLQRLPEENTHQARRQQQRQGPWRHRQQQQRTHQWQQQQQQQQQGPERLQQQQQQWLQQLTSLLPPWLTWARGGAVAARSEPVQLYAEWLLTCYVALPWRPYISVNGTTTFTLNGAANQIVRHVEAWDISGTAALLLLLRPSERAVWKRRRAE